MALLLTPLIRYLKVKGLLFSVTSFKGRQLFPVWHDYLSKTMSNLHSVFCFTSTSFVCMFQSYTDGFATCTYMIRRHTNIWEFICVEENVQCYSCTIASRMIKVLFSYFKVLTLFVSLLYSPRKILLLRKRYIVSPV